MNSLPEQSLYFIAIMPAKQIQDEINEFKHQIAQEFNVVHALKSPPHITLRSPFKFNSNQESLLKDVLKTFSNSRFTFTIELSGFNCFKPRVVFIEVANSDKLNLLEHDLNLLLKTRDWFPAGNQLKNHFHPHITLATRDVTVPIFKAIWDQYSRKSYSSAFLCDHISLLKHDSKRWQVYKSFNFKNA